jgi:hypothetical protein
MAKRKNKNKNRGKAPQPQASLAPESSMPVTPFTAVSSTGATATTTIPGLENHNQQCEIAKLKTVVAELQMTVSRLESRLEAANAAPQLVAKPQPQPQVPMQTPVPIQPHTPRKTGSLPLPAALRMVVVPLAKEEWMKAKRKASAMEDERIADAPRTTALLGNLMHSKHAVVGTIAGEGRDGRENQETLVVKRAREEVEAQVLIKRRKYYHIGLRPGLPTRHPDGLGETFIWEREHGRYESWRPLPPRVCNGCMCCVGRYRDTRLRWERRM